MQELNKTVAQKTERPVKVLQFGEGNFLRAFVDWILQEANDKELINTNVAVVQPIEMGRVKDLEKQDGLYTVFLEGIKNKEVVSQKQVIDVLDDFINPYTEYDQYLAYAKSEELRYIISNTTEAGIILDKEDTKLDTCPNSFPGKLLALLVERYKYFDGDKNKGLIILPCELIDHNGKELKKVMNELAGLVGLEEDFITWLNEANTFCSTLVDRIVTGYPRNEIEKVTKELGYVDNSVVKCEIFHLWVIETQDPKVKEEFPVDKAGLDVIFVDDLTPYKQRKVSILNGSHTAMVPVGYLYGIDTVRETVEDEVMGQFVKDVMFNEIIPTQDLPKDELDKFADEVLDRFKNPYIYHELLAISLNSTTKYKTRILPTVIKYLDRKNELPKRLLFSLASMLVFFKGERNGEKIPVNDNKEFLDMYEALWGSYDGSTESVDKIVKQFLGLKDHWEFDFAKYPEVEKFVSESVYSIVNDGMKAAIKKVM
ncbi:tagaturonate reductase [Natranaerovirga hydrolytica]|uniref:Tagaturonate reductase n=1 Tax=Natranaerovirga hydrolytica TaxID=680378 RepID=A0A4R1M992_9FIRM|nr:tagaturonate reductase [Natranaerovirga hydrolytica]TCK87982.1 tagaturonate reductase [Natranaerovirga hydrolytica]